MVDGITIPSVSSSLVPTSGRLTTQEKADLERDGFVVREDVFGADDLAVLRTASEDLVDELVRRKNGVGRMRLGSYVFEPETTSGVTIKWEGDTDVVLGIEPFAHFHKVFAEYGLDARFTEPAKDIVGADEVMLFTEKLNLKRAHTGGPVVLHQDYPYWVGVSDDIDRIMTTMLLLDDSDLENGCLEVVPGSHAEGVQPGKKEWGFGANEIDPDVYDTARLVPVPLSAGSMVMFGPRLVHRSLNNHSDRDRRALLYSYQPVGLKTLREYLTPTA